MQEIKEDVWSLLDENSTLCVLTNDTVIKMYDAVTMQDIIYNPMRAGIAGECKWRNPEFPKLVGLAILRKTRYAGFDAKTHAEFFRFSTKYEIHDEKSDLNLIEASLKDLVKYIQKNPERKIYLPRPGCGIGGLNWENEVKPLVEKYLGSYKNIYIVSK